MHLFPISSNKRWPKEPENVGYIVKALVLLCTLERAMSSSLGFPIGARWSPSMLGLKVQLGACACARITVGNWEENILFLLFQYLLIEFGIF